MSIQTEADPATTAKVAASRAEALALLKANGYIVGDITKVASDAVASLAALA